MPTYRLKMAATTRQGVPGEPPPGIWDDLQVWAKDETRAVEAAREIAPGWTVLKLDEVGP